MTAQPAIETSGLTKSYGGRKVLDGVDLAVARGSVFALLGPNGAGKTTTVRILATLVRPDGGQARVAGFDVARESARVRREISLTGQHAAVDENQTGFETLRMMGRLTGLSRAAAKARATDLLARFDLTEAGGRRTGTYSGGMRRRLDLAAGLVGRPSTVFLDEPTTGLDPRSRQEMWAVVRELAAAGVTILLTTQYLEEADQLADRIAVIDDGRVVADGTPTELKTRVSEQVLELTTVDPVAYERIVTRLGDRAVRPDAGRLAVAVPTDGSANHVRAVLDELDPAHDLVRRFDVRTATLDDVFLALTGHATVDRGATENKELSRV